MTDSIDFATWQGVNAALQGYANALDRADLPLLLTHFTEDAVWDYSPTASRRGHAEIEAFFEERLGVFARTSHNVGPPVVTRGATGDAVDSVAYFNAVHLLRDGSRYSVWGRYVDVLVRRDTRMLIARRGVVAHVTEGTSRTYNLLPRVR